MDELVRLQKYLADAGIASRRKCEELIAAGLVKVNGETAHIGDKVSPKKDSVSVNGRKISQEKDYVYIMLNKPRGFVTTMSDEMDRKCVAQLVADVGKRVYPVGRLDRDSEGLLLFTNDGAFANALTHPSGHMAKNYRVTVKPKITQEQLNILTSSIMIDGRQTLPATVNVIADDPDRTVLEIILYEGRNRQIRRLCEEAGLTTARLKRQSVGGVKLGMLQPGEWRHLTKEEVVSLKRQSADRRKQG